MKGMNRTADNYEFPTDQVFHNDELVSIIYLKSLKISCPENKMNTYTNG
jgi:hypothetical protein